jgi:hypothetical protein
MQRSLDRFSPENPRPVGYINHQQQPTTIIFHMINQQVAPENRNWKKKKKKKKKKTLPETRRKMQNFDGASKLARNTQNRLEVPKNRSKTLKNRTEQSLEARRRLAGEHRNLLEKTETSGHYKNSNNRAIEGYKVTFQQPKITPASFLSFFFFFFFFFPMAAATSPTTI